MRKGGLEENDHYYQKRERLLPTKNGVHAYYLNPYLREFLEPILIN